LWIGPDLTAASTARSNAAQLPADSTGVLVLPRPPDDELFDDLDTLELAPDIAAELGNMVVVWAFAEAALSHTLSVVSGMTTNMAMMGYYRVPTYEARTKFIASLIEQWNPQTIDKAAIAKNIASLNRLAASRNKWIHGIWARGKTTGDIVTFHLRERNETNRKQPIKAADIKNHNCAVRERAKQLYRLIGRVP